MRRTKLTALLAAMAVSATTAATAQAAPVTVGPPLTLPSVVLKFNVTATATNTKVAGGLAASPVDGAVIGWGMAHAGGGPFRLRVVRRVGDGFLNAGTSAPVLGSGAPVQTFPASLPIRAGDLIGLDNSNESDTIGLMDSPRSEFTVWAPPRPDGSVVSLSAGPKELESRPDQLVGFNAVVQPAPTLTAISPASGSIAGGTSVTIAGTDFANVSGVSFGGVPAASFTVASEGQIVAVAPPGSRGAVDVTVTTVAGTTPAAKFNYEACVVPKLKRKKLKAAKRQLRKAGCKPGKVKRRKGVKAKAAKVVKQGRKPGKQLAPGTKVRIVLG